MRIVIISAAVVVIVGLAFHDTPLVLSMWHVIQAFGNVLSAFNGLLVKR